MPARMHLRAVAASLALLALAACGPKERIVEHLKRVPCPPAAVEVECPAAPTPEAGDTWDSYKARVQANRDICQAALEAWREAWGECAE